MSEYLSKKAVLEWLDDRRYKSPWIESFREHLESGAFDTPEMEHINAYWAREGLIKRQQEEVQRLRAALERIKKWADDPEPVTMLKIMNLANETLKGDENNA